MDKMNTWIPIIELAVLAFTTLGTTITLYLHSESKMQENRRELYSVLERNRTETNQLVDLIRQDLRDFHGKMERQDAEFKAHLMYEHGKK